MDYLRLVAELPLPTVELPEDLKQRWSCRFTAFLRPGPIPAANLFHHEREAFANYERQHSSDPNIQRYGLLARLLANDTKLNWLSNLDLHSFMMAEATAQWRRLLKTLQMIREACVRQAGGGG